MATGTRGTFIREGLRTAVSVTAYPFLKGFVGIRNGVTYVSGFIFAYGAPEKELIALRDETVELKARVAQQGELLQENDRLRTMLQFVRSRPRYTVAPANILENFRGVLMVDRGALHKIGESMCVVTDEGIVGMVTQVDPLSASVVTLHNAECKIGAMIQRNRVRGVVHGSDSELSRYCTMNYIDMKDDVKPGDVVVTSPESLFPAGYPIGRVMAVHDENLLWKTADVMPIVDPYRLDEVFLLMRSTMSPDELAGKTETETVTPLAVSPPDERTLQERYAP